MKFAIYGAVAIVAAAAGFAIYRYGISPRAAIESTAAQPSSQAAQAPNDAPSIPTELPDFSLQDRDGKVTSIRSWTGKSMIVNFWATWCAPCRREIPLLRQIQHDKAASGFQVVGVAVDFRDDVLKYAKEIGIDYPILMGEEDGLDAVTKFGLGSIGFPFTVFTDSKGRIVLTHLGELTKPQSTVIIEVVDRVNHGELTPIAARTVAARQLQQLESPAT